MRPSAGCAGLRSPGSPQIFQSRRVGPHCGWWMSCHQQREKGRGRRLQRSYLGEAWVMLGCGSQPHHGFSALQLEEVKVVTSASHVPIRGIVSSDAVPEGALAASCFSEACSCRPQGSGEARRWDLLSGSLISRRVLYAEHAKKGC